MKYILYDDVEGTILGLDTEERTDYVTLTDDAYDFILQNNGSCRVKPEIADLRIQEYEQSDDPDFCIIDMSAITTEKVYDIEIIQENIIRKNSKYCYMYITNGIYFTLDNGERKKYTYKIEDQVNMEQLMRLVDNGVLNDETGIPVKASEESIYDLLSVSEFKRLNSALTYHKYYHLFYMRRYNEYIRTLTSETELHRLQYGMVLPDKYAEKIDEQLKNFKG